MNKKLKIVVALIVIIIIVIFGYNQYTLYKEVTELKNQNTELQEKQKENERKTKSVYREVFGDGLPTVDWSPMDFSK